MGDYIFNLTPHKGVDFYILKKLQNFECARNNPISIPLYCNSTITLQVEQETCVKVWKFSRVNKNLCRCTNTFNFVYTD
jgi:hypothetical protein